MSEQDLSQSVQELMAEMAQMRAELNSLKAVAQVLSQPVPQSKPVVSTTRRKALLSLAGD